MTEFIPGEGEETEEYNDDVPQMDPAVASRNMRLVEESSLLKARPSEFVANLIYLDGHPFSFEGRGYLKPVYNRRTPQVLLKTARQVEKSTLLCNKLVSRSVVVPFNKSLYVSPSHTQTRQFSNEKLRQAIEKSPKIKRYFQDSSVSTQVFEKGFTNGSYVFLRSAFRSADRARGISARDLTLDEIQDMYTSEIPVIMECTSHFPDYSTTMSGTPKTYDNTIEVYWQETTQNEWLVPCDGCSKWNYLDHMNIAPTHKYIQKKLPPGPICRHCGKPIDPRKGKWVSFQPDKMIEGYRISQLMVPWICGLHDQWLKLLWKRDNYPFGQFMNEAMGLSYDSAQKPVTRGQLMACCCEDHIWDTSDLNKLKQVASRYLLTAGVDWGEGNDGSGTTPTGKLRVASYTVLTIGAYIRQNCYKVFYMKRYTGNEVDPDHIIKDILRICGAIGVRLIGADWGHGWGVNNELVRKYGPDRVIQFQYVANLKVPMKWDVIGRKYEVSRNFMMSELFYDIKHGYLEFFRWEQFQDFGKDILAIFAEYSEYLRQMKYDHRKSDPDDAFHSLHYARLAADVHLGKSRRYTLEDPR